MDPAGELGLEPDSEFDDPCLCNVGERYDAAESGREGVLIVRTRSLLFKLRLEEERVSLG